MMRMRTMPPAVAPAIMPVRWPEDSGVAEERVVLMGVVYWKFLRNWGEGLGEEEVTYGSELSVDRGHYG